MRTIRFRDAGGAVHETAVADGSPVESALPPGGILLRPVDPPEVWCDMKGFD